MYIPGIKDAVERIARRVGVDNYEYSNHSLEVEDESTFYLVVYYWSPDRVKETLRTEVSLIDVIKELYDMENE